MQTITLTAQEIEQFEKDGVIILRNLVDDKTCSSIKDIAKVHLNYKIPPIELESEYIGEDKKEYKETVRRLRQVYHRDILFKDWMESPLLRCALEDLLKDKPVLVLAHHNSIMTKMPNRRSTQTRWHQDIRYWHYENDSLISIWLALGEENNQNGVLEFIPGSHKIEFKDSQFDEKRYFREDLDENKEYIDRKISFNLQTGDVVLFHCKVLHRANQNIGKEPKISFVYTVKAKSNPAIPNTRSAKFPEIEL